MRRRVANLSALLACKGKRVCVIDADIQSPGVHLEQQIQALRIEVDESRQTKKVAEITESDYFKRLSQQADDLRRLVTDPD
jgi:Mrp family chromosome partitioning ATPase